MNHPNFKDLTGKKFGRWKVLYRGPNSKNSHTRYFCRCDCGNEVLVLSLNLTRGLTEGCLKCSRIYRDKYHGMSDSKTYCVWIQMIERCYNINHKSYHNYGGRGIFVCDRWKEKFSNFIEDMGEKPDGMSIERIDNNSGYSKQNCKWENWKNQCRNKRNSIHDGDIFNGWIVRWKIPNVKQYMIECIECKRSEVVWSCNVRRKIKCNHGKKNEQI